MANRKPPRAFAEIQALAARWRTEWSPNDGIEPWLRRHLVELTGLIRNERWSWGDLARALNEAGILYGTGRPWSSVRLNDKVCKLRARQRLTSNGLTPQDLAAVIREALAGTAGGFANITINLPGADTPSREPIAALSRRRASNAGRTTRGPEPPPDDPESPAEPEFTFARLKGWSPPAPNADGSDEPPAARDGENQAAEQTLQEFLSRPRRGSIPMPPIPEPEDD